MQVMFKVYGQPTGKGRPRFSKKTGVAFTPKETVNYENLVRMEHAASVVREFYGLRLYLEKICHVTQHSFITRKRLEVRTELLFQMGK